VAGAATSLALALLIGGRVFGAMKRALGAGEWIRRGLGVAVLAGVVVIALGFDTRFLTQVSLARTAPLEQGLVDKLHPAGREQPSAEGSPIAMTGNPPTMTQDQPEARAEDLPIEGEMPSLSGAVEWLNSPPLTPEALRGKVAVVDFWTYSCINCLRSIPYVRAWAEKYKDQGLVVTQRDVSHVGESMDWPRRSRSVPTTSLYALSDIDFVSFEFAQLVQRRANPAWVEHKPEPKPSHT
jgi:thiol-disulfide isomerase/thioredoxin